MMIHLTNGFSLTIKSDGGTPYMDVTMRRVTYNITTDVTGTLRGKKQLMKLKNFLRDLLVSAPSSADGVKMREVGSMVEAEVPGMAYALLVSHFNNVGLANYVSNGNRADVIKMLRETADRLEANCTFPTPENN
jgi:hypothetical protein